MIKKILWLLVFWFVIFWFTNAFQVPVWLWYIESSYDSQFELAVLKKWKFLTNFLWTTKPMFALDKDSFVFWSSYDPNRMLYLYDKQSYECLNSNHTVVTQWYINEFKSCDEFTWSVNSPTNCSSTQNFSREVVWNFLRTITTDDWVYYSHYIWGEWYCRWFYYNFDICFSSTELHKALCFTVSHTAEGSAWWSNPFYWLWESLGLSDAEFSTINLSLLGDPPLYQWEATQVESWNIVSDPDVTTNWDVVEFFQNGRDWDYDLCYLWTDYLWSDFSGDYVNWQWLTIFEWYSQLYTWTAVADPYATVWSTSTMNVGAWLNTIMNNYYTQMFTRQDYDEFSCGGDCLHYSFWWPNGLTSINTWYYYSWTNWRPSVEFGWAALAVNKYKQVLNEWDYIAAYCKAFLSYSLNTEYEWVIPNSLINNINNYKDSRDNNNSTDWQVPSWSWFMFTWSSDFWESARNFYAKITEKLNTDWFKSFWIIPDYILWFLALILLFKFLKK